MEYTPSEYITNLKYRLKTETSIGKIASEDQLDEAIKLTLENPHGADILLAARLCLCHLVIIAMPKGKKGDIIL
jgi:hypothetical protein